MISETDLPAIERRLLAASGDRWELDTDDGITVVRIESNDGRSHFMRVTRESEPAGADDVRFIAGARRDLERLVRTVRAVSPPLTGEEIKDMEVRCSRASPGPWRVFLEHEGGLGGCDVIQVTEGEEPDLYLWVGDDLAPSADFELVGDARQDIPNLIAAVLEKELLSLLTEDYYGLWEAEIHLPVGRQRLRETIVSVLEQKLAEWFVRSHDTADAVALSQMQENPPDLEDPTAWSVPGLNDTQFLLAATRAGENAYYGRGDPPGR